MYSNLSPDGSLRLYHFIAMVTVVMILLSQFPTFHSLRHINLGSLVLSFGYTFLVVGACINAGKLLSNVIQLLQNECYWSIAYMSTEFSSLHQKTTLVLSRPCIIQIASYLKIHCFQYNAGTSKNAPPKDYTLESSASSRVFNAFTSISIIAAIFGNGILPEIQVTS